MSPNNIGDAESDYVGKSDFHTKKEMQKHATMRDDIYRKRYEHDRKKTEKIPTWLSILIYVGSLLIFASVIK